MFQLNSREWRIDNIYTIRNSDGILEAFHTNAAQREYYNRIHTCNHILKARKLGFSTFNMIYALDSMLFIANSKIGIVDYSLPDAKKKLQMIKLAYDNLDNPTIHPLTWELGKALKTTLRITKNDATEIIFSNGSSAYCGVSLRGDTINELYISELGKTAIFAPIKAREIITGALNALTPGNLIVIESTHEGGQVGVNYELMETAMNNDDTTLSPIQFRFHFFPWWMDTRYRVPYRSIRPETNNYFEQITPRIHAYCLARHIPIPTLTNEQKQWYQDKADVQKHGMKKEFPSIPAEAWETPAVGAIYPQIADIRADGRLRQFTPHPSAPLYTSWDIGVSDYTALWLIQPEGRNFLILDWYENTGEHGGHYIDVINTWERTHKRKITAHLLPHDADLRDRFNASTYITQLNQAGLTNIRKIPRTPDIWLGINTLRHEILPNAIFHTNTDLPREKDGKKHPSGLTCLQSYSMTTVKEDGRIAERPRHDQYSHSSDALRTFAEAWRLGLIHTRDTAPAPRIITPFNRPSSTPTIKIKK